METFATGDAPVDGAIAAGGGEVFWSYQAWVDEHHIYAAAAGATSRRVLVEDEDVVSTAAWGLAADDKYVYWAAHEDSRDIPGRGRLKRIRRCGGDPEVLVDDGTTVFDVAVSESAIYWTGGKNQVMRIKKE